MGGGGKEAATLNSTKYSLGRAGLARSGPSVTGSQMFTPPHERSWIRPYVVLNTIVTSIYFLVEYLSINTDIINHNTRTEVNAIAIV